MNKTLRNLALVALVAAPTSAFAEVKGAGTAADPYQIATLADLQECWSLTKAGATVYFVQTADIDMAGITEWRPFVGYDNSTYSPIVNYDGQNHVIKNFTLTDGAYDSNKQNCYNGSIFGVLNGSVKNLGIVDAKINSAQGSGIVAGWAGHATGSAATIENVYVTGSVETSYYGAGMIGTIDNDVTVKNCFANVAVKGTTATRQIGGLVGRINSHTLTIENAYAAGSVEAAGANLAGLITGAGSGTGKVEFNGVVAFNTGLNDVVTGVVADNVEGDVTLANTPATKAAGVAEVSSWSAFSAADEVEGLPGLAYNLSGEGTQDSPYIIDSAKALCNAWRYVDTYIEGTNVYFVQTADIDMEGVENYTTISGWRGGNEDAGNAYFAVIHYDGQNHVIKNFAPKDAAADAATNTYYCTTIFGVAAGDIKNLGVINADIETTQGAGILAGYAGHSTATGLTVDNVFVEGSISGTSYTGGMFGTTGNKLVITNSFANVDVVGTNTNLTGGIIGRTENAVELNKVYAAGTVSEGSFLIAGGRKAVTITVQDVVAFNNANGNEVAYEELDCEGVDVATEATEAILLADVKGWEAFSATKVLNGYPILKAFEAYGTDAPTSGIFDAAVDADAPAVYYNLQGVQVANPDNGIYIVRRGDKVTKELIRK